MARKGVAPLNKGLSRSDWGLRWEGPTGPHRSVSEVPAREPKQRRCRRSEAEPHAPTGLSPQVTGGRQTKVVRPSWPHRSVSEVSGRKQSSAGAGVAKRSRMPHRGCHRR